MLPIWPPAAKALFLISSSLRIPNPKRRRFLTVPPPRAWPAAPSPPQPTLPPRQAPEGRPDPCQHTIALSSRHFFATLHKIIKFCIAERWSKLVLGIRSSNGMERVQGGVVGSRQHVCQLPFQLGRCRHPRHYMSREPTRVPRIPDRETAEPASVSVLRDLRHLQRNTERALSSWCSNTKKTSELVLHTAPKCSPAGLGNANLETKVEAGSFVAFAHRHDFVDAELLDESAGAVGHDGLSDLLGQPAQEVVLPHVHYHLHVGPPVHHEHSSTCAYVHFFGRLMLCRIKLVMVGHRFLMLVSMASPRLRPLSSSLAFLER